MLYEEPVPPTMTMVLAMGPKLLVKSAVERNLTTKAREDYTSGEVAQLCAAAVHVIMRSGVEYEQASDSCVCGVFVCTMHRKPPPVVAFPRGAPGAEGRLPTVVTVLTVVGRSYFVFCNFVKGSSPLYDF